MVKCVGQISYQLAKAGQAVIHRDAQGQTEAIPCETGPILFVCFALFLFPISDNST